jgi:hypothetical protein
MLTTGLMPVATLARPQAFYLGARPCEVLSIPRNRLLDAMGHSCNKLPRTIELEWLTANNATNARAEEARISA